VGPSGAGKSTLLRLLNRLADPDRGVIRFAGRPLVDYDVLELRRTVALVPQLPALLDGTVEDNASPSAPPAGRRSRRWCAAACARASSRSSTPRRRPA
jgi:putative ABC transport system ATP-binding protein